MMYIINYFILLYTILSIYNLTIFVINVYNDFILNFECFKLNLTIISALNKFLIIGFIEEKNCHLVQYLM